MPTTMSTTKPSALAADIPLPPPPTLGAAATAATPHSGRMKFETRDMSFYYGSHQALHDISQTTHH